MGILSGNPQKQPLHYGEVHGTWFYLMVTKGKIAAYQTFLNHAGDHELRRFLEDLINAYKREATQVEEILKENGIGLPPAPPERPNADLESIPAGAKFNDAEIAASISQDIAASLIACSSIMGQCTREDIGMMFGQFHMSKAQFGVRLLRLQKEKGWLVPPPLHLEVPEAVTV